MVVVLSEFGRTFRENGNRGTDHGHGTVYWVLGGAINGGIIAGEQQRVSRGTLFQDRDYPGAQRLPRGARRLVPLAVGTVARAVRKRFPADRTARSATRVDRAGAGFARVS